MNNDSENNYNQTSSLSLIFNNFDKKLDFWFLVITIPLGILLNMISIYIYSRPNLNKTNMGFFYFHLSIWNTLVLIYYLFVMDSKQIFPYDLTTSSNSACKIVTFIRRCLREVPCWIEALITLERYLTICYPNRKRFKFIKSKSNFLIIIFITILTLGLISVENFFYFLVQYQQTLNETMITSSSYKCESTKFIEIFSDMISILFRTIIPGILMSIFSLLLIKQVKHVKKQSNSYSDKDRHFNTSILLMNLIFFILNVPVSVMYVIKNIYENLLNETTNSQKMVVISIFYVFSYHLANLHYSTMFFQFLLFNKLFKYEFMIVFGLNPLITKLDKIRSTSSIYHPSSNR